MTGLQNSTPRSGAVGTGPVLVTIPRIQRTNTNKIVFYFNFTMSYLTQMTAMTASSSELNRKSKLNVQRFISSLLVQVLRSCDVIVIALSIKTTTHRDPEMQIMVVST